MTDDDFKKDWYTQKEVIEMIFDVKSALIETAQDLKSEIGQNRLQIGELKVLIRDYNNYRARIDSIEYTIGAMQSHLETKEETQKDSRMNIYNLLSILIAIAAIITTIIFKYLLK
ncbi:MAG TPA: hypothetical protein VN426_00065 [Syntrophomonadaceae bacterium]|nr:hypothetical protein [Syntrophomonadaceae bacterium]